MTSRFRTIDINGEETPEQLIARICKEADIKREDIVLAWASPPCETYSRANWSNLSRGVNRRLLEEGFPPAEGAKGVKAAEHDKLTQKVMKVLGLIGRYVMENPQGGMEKMWFMRDWEDQKKIVDLCSFIWPFRKTTNLWAHGFEWEPKGVTGTGRCEEQCGQGSVDPVTKRFRHYMALAVDPQRGPRGAGATQMTCGIPDKLITEILEAVKETVELKGKVVLDLCAGFQSIRKAVLEAGAKYVAVDVMGKRQTKQAAARRAVVALRVDNTVLAVKLQYADSTSEWTMPGGAKNNSDQSLHSAGVRELERCTGIGQARWGRMVSKGPVVEALPHTTYYAYHLNLRVPKADLVEHFKKRQEVEGAKIVAWAWVDVGKDAVDGCKWREEDLQALKRWR